MRILIFIMAHLVSTISRNIVLWAIGQTTSADIAKEVDAFYDKTLLEPLKSARIYARYGQKRMVKENDTVRFSKYPILGTQPVSLAEGVNPDPQKLEKSTITATVSLYGGYLELTEECEIYRIDPVVAVAQERASWQGVETIDEITRDIIHGGTSAYFANAVANRTLVASRILAADLRVIARAMQAKKVPYFKPSMSGSTQVGTQPINQSWFMFISPSVLYDLEAITGFRNVATYPQGSAEENECGSFGYFRCILATEAPVALGGATAVAATSGCAATDVSGTSRNDVHQCLIVGEDAYGVIDCDGGMKTIRHDKSTHGGPLDLFGTVGWKIRFTAKILDEDRMYRYECATTA